MHLPTVMGVEREVAGSKKSLFKRRKLVYFVTKFFKRFPNMHVLFLKIQLFYALTIEKIE